MTTDFENKDIKVSVVMPAYNAGMTICASIGSVIDQTYKDWELIVINDKSTDDTLKIVSDCIADQPPEIKCKIRVLTNATNQGVSASRNRGVDEARYKWIAFLDSDDQWERDKLEKQIDLLKKRPDASILYTGSAFIKSSGERAGYILHVPAEIRFKELLKQNVISCSSALVKRQLLIENRMKHDEMHEDFLLWLTLLKKGCKAYGVDEPLLIYRLSDNSKSSDKKKAALMTYRVYKEIGLNDITALYYMLFYTFRNFKKYISIKNSYE